MSTDDPFPYDPCPPLWPETRPDPDIQAPIGVTFTNTTLLTTGYCPYCSGAAVSVYHDGVCPRVKSITYGPGGEIRRVEFK